MGTVAETHGRIVMVQKNSCRLLVRMLLQIVALLEGLSIVSGQAFAAGFHEGVDDLGNQIVLESPAVRIVSLAPHLTEILFELGVGDNIIATVSYADFPVEAKQIPRVGDAFSVNVEQLVAMQPDIIFAWETGGANKSLKRLESLGFTIFRNEAPTLAGIADTIEQIAVLVGKAEAGLLLSHQYRARMAQLARVPVINGSTEVNSARVFFQISDQDLYTVNGQHLIGQAIKLCGGENLFEGVPISVPLANLESVLRGQPDIIFITRLPATPASPWEDRWGQLLGDRTQILPVDPNLISRPSTRMLDGVEFMCSAIRGGRQVIAH